MLGLVSSCAQTERRIEPSVLLTTIQGRDHLILCDNGVVTFCVVGCLAGGVLACLACVDILGLLENFADLISIVLVIRVWL